MTQRPFNPKDPLAYFITWTCYGTWLHGDERGWHEWGKGERTGPDFVLKSTAKSKMVETEFSMSQIDRKVVEETIDKHCEHRGWTLHKVNARTNHVHIVVTAPGYAPETVRDQFKSWCTRNLKPHHPGREHFWTEGASLRYINHEEDLEAAIIYAGEAQDRKDRDGQY
jgi:REP element-mobilizing transposase RayT